MKAQAPVGDAAAADAARAGIVQLAKLAVLGQLAQVAHLSAKRVESDIMLTTPAASAASTSSRAASSESASGLVTMTCLPFLTASRAMGTCNWLGVPTKTASISGSWHISL